MRYICENCKKEHNGLYGSGRFCSSKCARGFSTKEKRSLINEKVSKKRKENAHNDIEKICPACNKKYTIHWNKRYQQACSRKCAKTILRNNPEYINKLKTNAGGYREKGGRGKQGWYREIYCNSSWELAYVIYCYDHNIIIKRNKEGFKYRFDNNVYKFYPDFIINNEYIEIKGYLDNKNKEKINQFPNKIKIIDKKQIQPYLKYVKNKYGEDFIKLYENK